MKKMSARLLSLALCAALLLVPAAAATAGQTAADQPEEISAPGPALLWGPITMMEGGSFLLNNNNKDNPNDEVVVHVGEETYCLDAVNGSPVDPATLKDGDVVYAYVGPAMALSLPPQATAQMILTNIPADFAVPSYHTVTSVLRVNDTAIRISTDQVKDMTVSAATPMTPYLTKNIVTYRDLIPGARFLAWSAGNGSTSKIMVFPYSGLPYVDVEKTSKLYDSILYVVSQGIVQPTGAYTFGAQEPMTRAQMVSALYQMAGAPEVNQSPAKFVDVPTGAAYENALTWAVGNKLVNGYSDGSFRPGGAVTREQMATFLYRWEQHQGGGFQGAWAFQLEFADKEQISNFAFEGVSWCAMKGILTGRSDNTLAPQDQVTRAAAAAMIERYMTLDKK